MHGTSPILEVKNVSRNFGGVAALRNISFALERGKILGLVGDNGAGRTTLLNILSGGLQPSSGEIRLDGEKVRFGSTADAIRMRIAMVHQFLQIVDIAPIWENFFMGRERTRKIGPLVFLDITHMKRTAADTIAEYGQTFDIEREMGRLSGGQRQIVAVTRAIQANPKLLLLDEPYTGLSKRVINDIFDILRKARAEKGISIIITSQWYEQISDFVDDVIVLRRGEIVGQCSAESADKRQIFMSAMGLTSR